MIFENSCFDSGKCSDVWNRVTNEKCHDRGEAVVCSCSDVSDLQKFMDISSQNARQCRAIAARCGGRTGRTMNEIAACEQCHLKKLRAEYFLITGNTYCPESEDVRVCTVSDALRTAYRNHARAAEEYENSAKNVKAPLSALYLKYARDEEKNANSIVCLVENMLC